MNDNFALRIQQLWQQSCESYRERILIIQKAVTALHQGKLTTEKQHKVEREAHTLIGSLSSFGLSKAADISRQIQKILQQEKPLEIIKAKELELLVQPLQQCIEVDGLTASSFVTSVYSRLLIIDNDIVFANQIATEASTKELTAQIAIDSEQAQKILADGGVDIILLNLDFQNNIEIGLNFLANLRSLYSEISIVIITQDDAFTTRLEVARLGIRYFLQKPIATAHTNSPKC